MNIPKAGKKQNRLAYKNHGHGKELKIPNHFTPLALSRYFRGSSLMTKSTQFKSEEAEGSYHPSPVNLKGLKG